MVGFTKMGVLNVVGFMLGKLKNTFVEILGMESDLKEFFFSKMLSNI